MSEFWNTNAAALGGGPLTLETLLEAFEAVRNAPPHPCQLGEHIVSSRARYRPGIYPCGSCGAPVRVDIPLSERA